MCCVATDLACPGTMKTKPTYAGAGAEQQGLAAHKTRQTAAPPPRRNELPGGPYAREHLVREQEPTSHVQEVDIPKLPRSIIRNNESIIMYYRPSNNT